MKNELIRKKNKKIIVFDLDETLGYFTQFGIFIDILNNYFKININQDIFNELLDLYPEYKRPGILKILNFLKEKKENKEIDKILIYTNNQGSRNWTLKLKNYFEYKINYKLFNQIICAYKIDNKIIEMCRTTNNKTYRDLCNCTKLPNNTKVCFIDDLYHPHMNNENVYYINIKPYFFDINFNKILNTFFNSNIYKLIFNKFQKNNHNLELNFINFKTYFFENLKYYNYILIKKEKLCYEIDKILYKKILEHLNIFIKEK